MSTGKKGDRVDYYGQLYFWHDLESEYFRTMPTGTFLAWNNWFSCQAAAALLNLTPLKDTIPLQWESFLGKDNILQCSSVQISVTVLNSGLKPWEIHQESIF